MARRIVDDNSERAAFLERVERERDARNGGWVVDARGFHVHPDHRPSVDHNRVDAQQARKEHREWIGRGDHDLLHTHVADPVYRCWLDDFHRRHGCPWEGA